MNQPLFEFPSPFPIEPGTVKLLEPPGTNPDVLKQRLTSGSYGRPFLIENEGLLSLYFSLSLIQSTMQIARPDELNLVYTRKMMAFLPFYPRPKALLLLGMGGGSLAKFCYRHLPRADITVVEINPDVIAFRHAFKVPADNERFRILCDDGADFVRKHPARTDIILVDAFDGQGIAPQLSNPDFYTNAYRLLSANGILVMNLAGDKAGFEDPLAQLSHVFDDHVLATNVRDGGNHVAFAFKSPDFDPHWELLLAVAKGMEKRFGLDLCRYIELLKRNERRFFNQRYRSRYR